MGRGHRQEDPGCGELHRRRRQRGGGALRCLPVAGLSVDGHHRRAGEDGLSPPAPTDDWCTEITVGYGTGSIEYYGYSADLGFGETFSALINQGTLFKRNFEGIQIRDRTGTDTVVLETSLDIPVGSVVDLGGTAFTIDAVSRSNTGLYSWAGSLGPPHGGGPEDDAGPEPGARCSPPPGWDGDSLVPDLQRGA